LICYRQLFGSKLNPKQPVSTLVSIVTKRMPIGITTNCRMDGRTGHIRLESNGRLVFQVRGVNQNLKPVVLSHVGRALLQEITNGH